MKAFQFHTQDHTADIYENSILMSNSQIGDSKCAFAINISSSINFSDELCNLHSFTVISSAFLERIHTICQALFR